MKLYQITATVAETSEDKTHYYIVAARSMTKARELVEAETCVLEVTDLAEVVGGEAGGGMDAATLTKRLLDGVERWETETILKVYTEQPAVREIP